MEIEKTNLKMIRGDTFSFIFELIASYGDENIDLDSAYFTIKLNKSDENYVLQKSIGSGIEKIEENKYRVELSPEDTHDIEPDIYNYDLQISKEGKIITILIGTFEILEDVTREV